MDCKGEQYLKEEDYTISIFLQLQTPLITLMELISINHYIDWNIVRRVGVMKKSKINYLQAWMRHLMHY